MPIEVMQGIVLPFLGTFFGAGCVFFMGSLRPMVQRALTGFAAGVMVAASIWSLLIPGMERAKELGQTSYLVMSAGFLAGVGLLLAADRWIQKKSDGKKSKSTQMLVIAITAHNIPEGMAVGLAFALAAANPGNEALFSGAVALTIGIGIQNYPEGTAVALPLARDGSSKGRAFLAGSMSAIVEPVFGVLAALLAAHTLRLMPLLLAMAAGAMIYVVVQELIPEAHLDDEDKSGTLGFVVGFIIMMILDIALG